MVLQETQFVSKKQIMGWLLLYLERPVLLWVKNFQQCCSRITMEVGMGDFVYLVAEGTVSSQPSFHGDTYRSITGSRRPALRKACTIFPGPLATYVRR